MGFSQLSKYLAFLVRLWHSYCHLYSHEHWLMESIEIPLWQMQCKLGPMVQHTDVSFPIMQWPTAKIQLKHSPADSFLSLYGVSYMRCNIRV